VVRVEAVVLAIRRGSKKSQMPSQWTNLALAHARTSDLASNCLKGDARVTYSSLTKWRQQKKGRKRNTQPSECLDIITCPFFDEYSHPPSSPISKKGAVIIFMNLYFFA
jgi:hypothetical protein